MLRTLFTLLLAATSTDMVHVPAGPFRMGADDGNFDEAPVHQVTLRQFWIDRAEVTNGRFDAFVRGTDAFDRVEGPWFRSSSQGAIDIIRHYEKRHAGSLSSMKSTHVDELTAKGVARWRAAVAALKQATGEDASSGVEPVIGRASVTKALAQELALPVRWIAWRDAAAFCASYGHRLPTEAEWERAARGTDLRLFAWGETFDSQRCNLGPSSSGPVAVGSRTACTSASGAVDMAGNVWEWVSDWYGERFYASPRALKDPSGPDGLPDGELPLPRTDVSLLRSPKQGRETDTRKVIRGGSFGGTAEMARFNARVTRRLFSNPNYWHPDVGFRCATDER